MASELDLLRDEQDGFEPDLETLVRSKADGDHTNDSLNFLNLLAPAAEVTPIKAEKPAPVKAEEPKPDATGEIIKAINRPKRYVKDDDGEIIGQETVDSLTPKPDAAKADKDTAEQAAPDSSGVGAAQSDLEALAGEASEEGLGGKAKKVAADIGEGAVEAPLQIAGGVVDAFNNFIAMGDILNEAMPLPGFQLFDDKGNFSPDLLSAAEVTANRKTESGKFLPTTDKADTVTGGMVRNLTKFVTGFRLGGKFLPAGKVGTTTFFGRSMGQGLFSDLVAFDGHEERLSNLIQSVPALQNPITEYLAADADDSELEGRLKNGIEGLIPDTLFSGVLTGLRAIKKARAVKVAAGAKTYTQAADALVAEVKATGQLPASDSGDVFRAIGDSSPNSPLTAWRKLKASEKATELPVPADVAAKGIANAGKQIGPDGVTVKTVMPEKAVVGDTFINFARINTDDDIEAVMKDMAEAFSKDVSTARRGVQTNIQTIAKASGKYADVWKDLVSRRRGELNLNAEQQLAMRHMWTASGEKLLETAKLAEAMPTAENLLSFRKMLTVHNLVQNQALAVRTETARALQQWNIPAGVGGKNRISAMHNILLQHGGADVNIDLARRFAGLANEVAANPANMGKVATATEQASKATTLKAVNELWIGLSLLSGPKTHVRNAISNMGMLASSIGERAIAARVGGMLDDRSAVAMGEASAQAAATFFNVKKAWMDAVDTFKTGKMKMGMSQLDIPPEMAMRSMDTNTVLGKTMYGLSYAPQTVFRGLQASDQFFKTLNFEGEMAALAHRAAVQAAQNGDIPHGSVKDFAENFLKNPPQSAVDNAMEAAAVRTFTNEPGKLTKYILRGRNEFPASRFIIPFVNTPSNVFRTSIEYSPLAPVLTKYRNAIAKGGADAALARTRMALGSSAMLAFVDMSMEGKITGSGPPPGSAEYAALKRTGWKPYTVKIGDKWVSYRGVEPFSTVMGMGADIGDYLRYADDDPDNVETVKDMLSIGVFSVADNMLDRAFLKGMADTVAAVTDPERYGPNWIDSFSSSFVPRGLTEIRYATDTTVRDARTMMDAFKARIPYMSMTVPERRDEWGRVQSMESGWGKAYDAMSPFYAAPIKAEPIDQELIRQGFGAGAAQRGMKLDGVSISFKNRADIHNRYLELRGQTKASGLDKKLLRRYGDATMLEVLNGMVTGDHKLALKYAKASDGEGGDKHKLIQKIVMDYGRAARKILVDEFPEVRDKVAEEEMKRRERFEEGDKMIEDLLGAE